MLAERYTHLWTRLHGLREAWLELHITVREDRPPGEATMLVDRLGDAIDDAVGALEEALAAVTRAIDDPDDVRAAGRSLHTAHARLGRTWVCYWQGLGSPDRRRELDSIARRRGSEWASWAASVDDSGARLPRHVTAAHEELGHAWTDLVERAASGAAYVSAHSIGQQINVPGAERALGTRLEDSRHASTEDATN
jgi:AcrR family transcriptional regulator